MASNDHTKNSTPAFEYEKWKQHIIDIVNKTEEPKTTKWTIYKVPCNLRNLDNKHAAYTPQLVSIGPIHHGVENLNSMQDQKLRYSELFWSRRAKNKTKDMDKFKIYLEDEETNIRQCYAENLSCDKISKEKLVEMMFLDSVFIMELFLRVQSQNSFEDDIIVKQLWLNKSIQRDLLLLENQIPLFILIELYNFVPASDPVKMQHQTFIELARHYFECFHTYKKCDEETGRSGFKGEPSKNNNRFVQLMMNCVTCKKDDTSSGENTGSSDSNTKHFTDLIRSFYICKGLHYQKKGPPLKTTTKLREAGVSFEKVQDRPLLAIKFRKIPILSRFLCFGCIPHSTYFKARLQIPELKVDDTTECVLRNLIAFEQCHYPDQPCICNYVSFIDSLIHTKDDVELLVEKEVIVHELGSDKEVATLVNGLCKHVVTDKTCYIEIINSLNKHYQRQWNRTMAALRLVYFRDAWRASSTLVATAVLVFTIFNFCRVVRLVLDLEGRRQP